MPTLKTGEKDVVRLSTEQSDLPFSKEREESTEKRAALLHPRGEAWGGIRSGARGAG